MLTKKFNKSIQNNLRPIIINNGIQKRNFGIEEVMDPSIMTPVGTMSIMGIATTFFMIHRYRVSKPHEYLVRTGLGIKDMTITKQGFQWPFQTYKFINMQPRNYSFDLAAMSCEKLEFKLPGVFTIGPKDDNESLKKYAKLLSIQSDKSEQLETLIKGIIEGETRIESAQLTLDQIFGDRRAFKEKLVRGVQDELDKFGLEIYNANIKELEDTIGSEFFSFNRQKKRSEAENQARIDIAEASKAGDIGQKERQAITRQKVAMFESETVQVENERNQEIEKSKAELEVVKAEAFRKQELAKIEAQKATEIREMELLKEVQQRRILMETEKMRAGDLSHAQVNAEVNIKDAEGKATALKLEADAKLYAKQKEADGILSIYEAQSKGVNKLIESFGNNPNSLIQYLMLDNGLYQSLAETNAKAIQGLAPKVTIWNTNTDKGTSDNYTKPIADIFKMIPPLVSTIHDQTGIKPADWIMNMKEQDKLD